MATGGPAGGSGGSVAPSAAATRVNVIDPHILQMMRDVMSAQESAPRLKVGPGAGGGGGGGGGCCGVLVLITTAASTTGSLSVAGGEGGAVGSSVSGQAGVAGEDGSVGKIVHVVV